MQPLDFIQLVEQRLAALEARLQQVDLRLTEEVKKAVSIAKVDLPFSLAKARHILELVIQDIYRRELPREKPKPLFNMIEALEKVKGLFTEKLALDISYIRKNGNLMVHAQDGTVEIQERDVEAIILLTFNVVEWYLVRYRPTKTGAAVVPPTARPIPPNPYRGLAAFREEDSRFFFGRDQEADELVARVAAQPLTAVVGASGSGKSSLVFAGLFPRLRAQGQWRLVTFRPQNRPFYELARVMAGLLYEDKLERAEKTKELAEKLDGGQIELATLVELALEGSPDRLLLVVDQFEELYTLNPDPALQQRFVEVLLKSLVNPADTAFMSGEISRSGQSGGASGLHLLMTLRADFMAHALACAPLAQALDRYAPKLLGPIADADALRTIIEQPARQLEIAWEPLLIERILRDLRAQPAGAGEAERISLPLLQFTLEQVWHRQTEGTLTHLAYEELGGVQRALAHHADTVLTQFGAPDQERLRHIFTQLVCPGEGTEDTRQVATKAQVGEANWDLVSRLADERLRLVVTGRDAQGQETVELIHEALIRHWPPLQQWVTQNRQFRVWQNRLRLELQEWQQHDHDPSILLRGSRLAEAEERLHQQVAALSPAEQAYIQASIAQSEQAAKTRRRRQRRLIAGLAVGLLVTSALAGFAFVQRNRAEHARKVATWSQGQAEGLINYMLFDLRHKLEPIGRLDLLEGVAKTAGEYFERLPSEEISAESEHNRAVALMNQADVQQDFGNLPMALELYQKGLNIMQRLAQQDPANAQWQHNLAASHSRIGNVRQAQGDLAGALTAYQAALAITERWAQQNPAHAGWQRDLAVSHEKIGNVRQAQGDLAGALTAYQAALAITERWAQQNPAHAGWQRDLAVSHNKIGDVRQAQGDLTGALTAYQAALAIRERLAQQDPANAQWQRDLATSHERIGDVRQVQGDLPGALAAYQAALAIRERLAQQDPANADWQRGLSVSHNNIGDVRQAQGDFPGALAAFQASLTIDERLAQQDPANADWQRGLSISHNKIGGMRQAQGDLPGALAAYQAALAIRERLAQQDPANADWQRDLAISHNKIGDVRQAQGDLPGALAAHQTTLAIAERLAQQDPANAQWQRDLAISHNKIGDVRQAQGDLPGALAAYQAALAIRERLAQQDPANTQWQYDLGASYDRLGKLHAQQGNFPQARVLFEKELEVVSKLFAKTQATNQALTYVYNQLAHVCADQGDTQAALTYQRQLVAEGRKLANPPGLAQALAVLSSLEMDAGNTSAARDAITETLTLARDLHAKQQDNDSRQFLARILGAQSFTLLFDRQFKEAIAAAEEALTLASDEFTTATIATNQAHGYLLSGQFEKAEAIYSQHARDKVNDQQTFAEAVLDDFAKLRQRGIDYPDMKKIEAMLHATPQ
ncbi:MAG: hypothetical protein U1F76_10250 [Candidatus Competibacteraceae bacterium]